MRLRSFGEVAEWPNAAVLKTVASQGAVSSNLTLSARFFIRAIAILLLIIVYLVQKVLSWPDKVHRRH